MYNNNYGGMNMIWWIIWAMFLFWIFFIPLSIPGQRFRKDSPLDILRKRFASGEITNDEYQENKKILENDILN
ncbi:MAG TPA: SHOCT domain-containing protein [Hanamia sp.]